MKKYLYILIFTLLTFCQKVYALENAYPEILGYKITDNSEFVDYVSYSFSFIISISSVILIFVIIMSGIDFILAGGNPSKVSEAKKRIKNGFIGITILFFSYLILHTINAPVIDDPKLEKCVGGGVIVTIEKPDTKPKEMCIWETQSRLDIDGTINPALTKWTFKDGDLKEVWAFNDYDFKGDKKTLIFQDMEYLTDLAFNPNPIPADTKSILILEKEPGLYIYDAQYFKVEDVPPFFASKSLSDLNNVSLSLNDKIDYSNKASSLSFVWDKSNPHMSYRAILFEDTNYAGKCFLAGWRYQGTYIPLVTAIGFLGQEYLGDNTLSSFITYKADDRNNLGKIVLYNATDCSVEDDLKNKCEILVNDLEGYGISPGNVFGGVSDPTFHKDVCPEFEGNIKSVSIEGKAAFVIRSTTNYCMYFDVIKNNNNNCIKLEDTGVFRESTFNYETGETVLIRPKEIMVFPIND